MLLILIVSFIIITIFLLFILVVYRNRQQSIVFTLHEFMNRDFVHPQKNSSKSIIDYINDFFEDDHTDSDGGYHDIDDIGDDGGDE